MTSAEECKMPEEFTKIIKDFIGDIKITFPEFATFVALLK